MRVVLVDDGVVFDGKTPDERPLGGAESAFVALAQAIAAQGHETHAFSKGARAMDHKAVVWRDVSHAKPAADLFIANRHARLLNDGDGRKVLWLHNPASFLAKPRFALPLLYHRPTLVFAGPHHAASAPRWIALPRVQIPLGVETPFLETPRGDDPPQPIMVYASNPMRGLTTLSDVWRDRIAANAPQAHFHIYAGPGVYDAQSEKAVAMRAALAHAAAAPRVVVHDPLPKAQLARVLAQARVMAYLGDPGETFCLALAEAQAMGVPCVVKPVGAVAERVIHGETGFVETDDAAFAARVCALLTDDALWRRCSEAARARRSTLTWARAAESFLALA